MRLDEQNRVLITYNEIVPVVLSVDVYDIAKRRNAITTTLRGGRGREVEIIFDLCKPSYQKKITAALGDVRKLAGLNYDAEPVLSLNELTAKELEICQARYSLVKQYRRYAEANKEAAGGVKNAKNQFIDLVISHVICPEEYKIVDGKISFQTVERWDKRLRDGNEVMDVLAVKRREPVVECSLSDTQQKYLLKAYYNAHKPQMTHAINYAFGIFRTLGEPIPSESKCRRHIIEWGEKHAATARALRYGVKALNDNELPYIDRDPDSINFMDMIVSDGHVMNFTIDYQALDKTGKRYITKKCRPTIVAWQDMRTKIILGFELMIQENTMCVASSFRNACINAGKLCGTDGALLPRVVYMDNGRAFKNKYFNETVNLETSIGGLYERLKQFGLEEVKYALPYNAQTKIIERSWRDFSELEEFVVGYTGNNITNKPAWMMRNELFHRTEHDRAVSSAGNLTLWGAYAILEQWIVSYNAQVSNGKYLAGKTPLQLAGEQIPELDLSGRFLPEHQMDYLMMNTKVCRLTRNGISVNGRTYYNGAKFLNTVKGSSFIVKYDILRPEKITVCDQDGRFWCEAGLSPFTNHHAAASLGSQPDRARLNEALQLKGQLKKAVLLEAKSGIIQGVDTTLYIGEANSPMRLPEQTEAEKAEIELMKEIEAIELY